VGVRQDNLDLNFLQAMTQLSEVRRAEKIAVRYRSGNTVCETEANAGIDENQILWMTDDASDMAPFEALAERLFRAAEHVDAAPYKLFQAVDAVRKNYRRLAASDGPGEDGDRVLGAAIEDYEASTQRSRGTFATGHRNPIVPNPAPFVAANQRDFEASGHVSRRASGSSRTPSRGSTSGRRNTVLEEIQKTELKLNHYAFHCQACLGLHQPNFLTPRFTYLWDKDYRGRNIEAHHVEHLRNHGALGAGNLLILCEYHHDFLGDRLNREDMMRALQSARTETRQFPADADAVKNKRVVGRVIMIELDVPPYQVPLFFTAEHASAWLPM
jgi:hypothetical protein